MEDNQTCHQPQPVVETGSLILSVYYPDQEGPIVSHVICESDFSENDETVCSFDKKQSKNVILNISQTDALLKLLRQNSKFRVAFLIHQKTSHLNVTLAKTEYFQIDQKSCDLVNRKLWESIEREDALHWLSTLGGAFSNLGEHNVEFAKRAGDNALRQMRIIVAIGDPSLLFHCWIFISMSLMQQKRLRESRKVLEWIYNSQKSLPADQADSKVIKMCLGCWSRLKFHWQKQGRTQKCPQKNVSGFD